MALIDPKIIWDYTGKNSLLNQWTPFAPWFNRAGKVIDILATPCHTTPWIWVNAAFTASPRLIYLKSKPFIQAEEAYRFLDSKCGKRGIVRRLAAALGLQNAEVEVANIIGDAAWAGFKIAGDFALKAEWYFMIADRVTEFAYNWTSLVYQWEGCKTPVTPYCELVAGAQYILGVIDNDFQGWVLVARSGMSSGAADIIVPAGVGASLFYTLELTEDPIFHKTSGIMARIRNSVTGDHTEWRTSTIDQTTGHQKVGDIMPYEGAAPTSQNYQLQVIGTGPAPPYGTGTFSAYGAFYGKKGLNFDP